MKRQRILPLFLLVIVVFGIVLWKDNKREAKTEEIEKGCVLAGEYCSMEDLGEMDYDLFCYTEMSSDVGPVEYVSVVIDSQTQTIEEARALYLEFKERLSLEEEEEQNEDEGERTEISYVSPDCKWIVTQKWSEHQTMNTQMLFHEKEKIKEQVCEASKGVNPILLVKKEDIYQEMEEGQYKKLLDIRREIGYRKINAEGELYARTNVEDSLLTIGAIKDGTDQWSYDLEGIKEETREIRESKGYEEDSVVGVFIEQFEGNEQEGWLVVQAGSSSFFRIAYPSGEVTYLGEYLYSPCFSPDGKYLAYSGIDYDNVVGMDLEEEKKIPPLGIYIREVETGKTAYIDWDRLPENRSFVWLEREGFEEYMADTGKSKSCWLNDGEAAELLNLEGLYDKDVVSDFLSMDREAFEKQYDKNGLYERDILYCTEEAWKYHGEQLDGFSDPKEYFEVDDIWAIRFVNPGLTDPSINVETDHLEDVQNRIAYQCFEDYAVSMYFREKNDVQGKPELEVTELSFIKVKLGKYERRKTAPKKLYEILESGYYEAREEIEAGEWAVSPEKTKAVCISNGALPKHPSQIFVRYREKAPDLIFRRTWECFFVGWIDEEHFLFRNDIGLYMVHIETGQIEEIVTVSTQEGDFETWGCRYEIRGDQVIATCIHDDCYYWDIVREAGEISLVWDALTGSGESEVQRYYHEAVENAQLE